MSELKFNLEQEVTYQGEKVTIVSSNKNFSNKQITYNLSNGTQGVDEDALVAAGNKVALKRTAKKETPKEEVKEPVKELTIEELNIKYKKLLGKKVANAYKKKRDWILKKIEVVENNNAKYEALAELGFTDLCEFVKTNNDTKDGIDVSEYNTEDLPALLEDVCDLLDIQLPLK